MDALCASCLHSGYSPCCGGRSTELYVSVARENAARRWKAETAESLTSLSGADRYPDRKQLDAPLNTSLKNT